MLTALKDVNKECVVFIKYYGNSERLFQKCCVTIEGLAYTYIYCTLTRPAKLHFPGIFTHYVTLAQQC